MSPRLAAARAHFQAAYVRLLEALEEESAHVEDETKPPGVDEVAQAKARRALERHGLRKVGAKR